MILNLWYSKFTAPLLNGSIVPEFYSLNWPQYLQQSPLPAGVANSEGMAKTDAKQEICLMERVRKTLLNQPRGTFYQIDVPFSLLALQWVSLNKQPAQFFVLVLEEKVKTLSSVNSYKLKAWKDLLAGKCQNMEWSLWKGTHAHLCLHFLIILIFGQRDNAQCLWFDSS